jgi:RNA-splicing ligase RtcB
MRRIKTFGTVDERSLNQLKRCMEAGEAEFGVLCADHHPGYSQPIGGGIAYEGHISPSGVGYDMGCIAAGARVTTSEGNAVPIEDSPATIRSRVWTVAGSGPSSRITARSHAAASRSGR